MISGSRFSKILRKKQAGLTLVETAMVLGVVAISMAGLSTMLADNARVTRVKATSERMIEVVGAAEKYVNANYTQLTTLAGPGAPIVIPVGKSCPTCAIPTGPGGLPSVQGGGFLSSTFVDSNAAGQRHAVLVREPTAGNLEVLITTWGGNAIADDDLGSISGLVGSGGGGVYQNNPNAPSTQVVGAYGGWTTNVATWNANWSGNAVGPSVGRAAVALSFGGAGGNMDDYLNRFNTGDPEANRMRTAIDMNGFDINNANVVRSNFVTASVDVTATRDVTAGRNVNAGNNVNANVDANAGRDTTAARNVRAGQDVIAGGVVYATSDSAAVYGQTSLRRWGLVNQTGDIYIQPEDSGNLILRPFGNADNGSLISNFGSNEFRSGANFCNDNAFDCRVQFSDEGFVRDLNDGWTRYFGNGEGFSIDGPNARLNVNGIADMRGVVNNYQQTNTYGLNQNFGNIAMSAGDAVLYSNGFGLMDLIGTYSGWDRDAIYIGGYNRANRASTRTQRVYFGGNGTPNPVRIELSTGDLFVNRLFANQQYASIYYDRDDTNYLVDPNNVSNLRELNAENINANFLEVDSILLRNRSQNVRLEHMIPRMVPQYTYFVQQSSWNVPSNVPKPSCPQGGSARILITPTNLSFSINIPNIRSNNSFQTGGWVPYWNVWRAVDNGSNWQAWIDIPEGGRSNVVGDAVLRYIAPAQLPTAIASTFCYYP